MMWLDFKIFGNGHGMAQPFWDGCFYYLVDTYQKDRNAKNGRFYKWICGLGAQLESREWFAPPAGTRRKLFGKEFKIFRTKRFFLRVECSWALVDKLDDFDQVRALKSELNNWGCGA